MARLDLAAALAACVLLAACAAGADQRGAVDPSACASQPVHLQVLGSGGPIADDPRAGASNLVWVDGKARLLVDAGGGAFLRYSESGARFEDLDAILLTHLHGDHAGDLASILNAGSFTERRAPLPVIGPDGSDLFPGTAAFLEALVGREGAFRYLYPYLDGSAALPRLEPMDVAAGEPGRQRVLDADGLTVDAIAVHHGGVPALAYVVTARGKTIVFAGDQSFLSTDFVELLAGSRPDVLVMHDAINGDPGQPRGLHRDPDSIGETAAALAPGKLVLTHHMQRALTRRDEVLQAIGARYKGPLQMADDGMCIAP